MISKETTIWSWRKLFFSFMKSLQVIKMYLTYSFVGSAAWRVQRIIYIHTASNVLLVSCGFLESCNLSKEVLLSTCPIMEGGILNPDGSEGDSVE